MQNQNPNNEDKNVVTLAERVAKALDNCAEARAQMMKSVEVEGSEAAKSGVAQLFKLVDKVSDTIKEGVQEVGIENISAAYLSFLTLLISSINAVEDPVVLRSLATTVKLNIDLFSMLDQSGNPPVTH